MSATPEPRFFVGIDWAVEKHDVCVIDHDANVVEHRVFEHSGDGLAQMADRLLELADGDPLALRVAIEIPTGAVVDTLLERLIPVFSINPKQLDRFRDRFSAAGAKDDRRDAHVLADSVRTDLKAFRPIHSLDADTIELREWSRLADELQQDRVRAVNRLREHLRRFFPQFLALGDDPGENWTLELLALIPTPDAAVRAKTHEVAQILKRHRIRRIDAATALAALRKTPLRIAPGTVPAVSARVAVLAQQVALLNAQLRDAYRRLDVVIEKLSAPQPAAPTASNSNNAPAGQGELSDAAILHSLPGVGRIVLSTLLAEAGQALREKDYHILRARCGCAPVTRRSGKQMAVVFRRACHQRLRTALYHWARTASQCDPHWKARYAAARARGKSHGHACRIVADGLLLVAVAMLRCRVNYDPHRLNPHSRQPA